MAYMAQAWLTTAVHDAYRGRADAVETAAEAARVRAWLAALPLDRATLAALVEPIDALEDGLRQAMQTVPGSGPGAGASSA